MTSSASTIDRRHTAGTPWRSSSVIASGARRRCSEMRRPHCVCRPKMRFIADARIRTRCIRRCSRSRSARSSSDGIHSSGTKSRRASSANTRASTLSVLHASGATSTGRPPESESPVSWSGAPQGPGKVAVCTNARTCLSLNLAPCLNQRGRVAPGTTWGHWTNRDESGLCRGPGVEQGYKQVKGELGWADFQVRSDRAIRRHWALVCCSFSFCWQAVLAEHPTQPAPADLPVAASAARGALPIGHRRRTGRQDLWPVALRAVRAWLIPWTVLARCWRSWSPAPPPRQLQQLLEAVAGGQPLHLYLPP
jgi:hypothetical protein